MLCTQTYCSNEMLPGSGALHPRSDCNRAAGPSSPSVRFRALPPPFHNCEGDGVMLSSESITSTMPHIVPITRNSEGWYTIMPLECPYSSLFSELYPETVRLVGLGSQALPLMYFFFLPMACVLPPGRLEKAGDILLDMLRPIYHRWPKLETSSTRRPRTESFEWLVSRLLSLNRRLDLSLFAWIFPRTLNTN